MKLYQTITIAVTAAGLAQFAAFGADRRQTYEELAASSDRVVLGTVGVRSSHWGDDAHIYTDVLVYPDVTAKGADEGAMLVQMLGGTVGGTTTMTVSDGPIAGRSAGRGLPETRVQPLRGDGALGGQFTGGLRRSSRGVG